MLAAATPRAGQAVALAGGASTRLVRARGAPRAVAPPLGALAVAVRARRASQAASSGRRFAAVTAPDAGPVDNGHKAQRTRRARCRRCGVGRIVSSACGAQRAVGSASSPPWRPRARRAGSTGVTPGQSHSARRTRMTRSAVALPGHSGPRARRARGALVATLDAALGRPRSGRAGPARGCTALHRAVRARRAEPTRCSQARGAGGPGHCAHLTPLPAPARAGRRRGVARGAGRARRVQGRPHSRRVRPRRAQSADGSRRSRCKLSLSAGSATQRPPARRVVARTACDAGRRALLRLRVSRRARSAGLARPRPPGGLERACWTPAAGPLANGSSHLRVRARGAGATRVTQARSLSIAVGAAGALNGRALPGKRVPRPTGDGRAVGRARLRRHCSRRARATICRRGAVAPAAAGARGALLARQAAGGGEQAGRAHATAVAGRVASHLARRARPAEGLPRRAREIANP